MTHPRAYVGATWRSRRCSCCRSRRSRRSSFTWRSRSACSAALAIGLEHRRRLRRPAVARPRGVLRHRQLRGRSCWCIDFGISPWIGMFAGVAVVAVVAARDRAIRRCACAGPFFSLATIALLEVARLLVNHLEALDRRRRRAERAAADRPEMDDLPREVGLPAGGLRLPDAWCSGSAAPIRHSRFGYYLIAVREREDAARAVGSQRGPGEDRRGRDLRRADEPDRQLPRHVPHLHRAVRRRSRSSSRSRSRCSR